MLRFILRRLLYVIPTVFGVILFTFLLFNVAGGDPALKKLGKNADSESLEDYDLQRGYDKPLICGMWGKTRAYRHETFEHNAGPWTTVEGVSYDRNKGHFISVSSTGDVPLPLAIPLQKGRVHRWVIETRSPSGTWRGPVPTIEARVGTGTVVASLPLNVGAAWGRSTLAFETGAATESLKVLLRGTEGRVDIRRVELRRRAAHFFDSQLVFYLNQLVHGDFGISHETNQRVSRMILDGIGPSLSLTVPMFIIGLALEISLALVCAFYRNRLIDRLFVVFAVMMMSVNYLVWIMLAQQWLGFQFRWFPVWGYESWYYLVLPVIVGVVHGLGSSVRFYRTIMLDELYRDYVRTAEAKGVGRTGILFRHVLKNAMIPILTSVVAAIPFLYTGSLLLETFFGIPGLGNLAINALNSSDFDVIRAVVFVGALLFVVANLMTDLCYAWMDPRIRLQ